MWRTKFSALSWNGLQLQFNARTKDWLIFYFKYTLLGIVTLDIGFLLFPYFYYNFICSHFLAEGSIDYTRLGQSQTVTPGSDEGLGDALGLSTGVF